MGSWDQTNQKMLAILFMTIVKLSYEPKVRESIRIIQILQESLKYPWFLLEYKDVEAVLDWFVMSAEPSVILKIPSENTSIDNCVINLLETASCMKELPKDAQNIQKSVVTAKRMAYVRSIVRIMKSCDAKLNQLMTTQQGREMFNQAVISLMNSISNCFMNSQGSEIEVTNLLIPITQGMAVPESTSKLFADALSLWQTTCQTGDIVLVCTLDALKVQKQWTIGIYQLLNSTLMNYFRVSGKYKSKYQQ
jgi:ectopic P granules protein 5